MKKNVIIIFCFFYSLSIFAQGYYFNKRYDLNAPGLWDGGTNIMETVDGYYMCGTTGSSGNFYWHRLGYLKIDKQGNKIFNKTIGDEISEYYFGFPGSMLSYGNDSIYTVGAKRTYTTNWVNDEGLLILYDNNFDSIWSKTYGNETEPIDTSFNFNQIYKTSDNNFIIIGTLHPYGIESRIYMVCVKTNGDKIFQKYFGAGSYYYKGYSVIQTTDGGYAVGGYRFTFSPYTDADPIIYKTDSLGNLEWEKNLGGPYDDYYPMITLGKDGNIVVGTNYCDSMSTPYSGYRRVNITKLDNQGIILWNKKYGSSITYHYFFQIRTLNDGSYIASGSIKTEYPHRAGWLFKISEDGDSIWYRQYNNLMGSSSENYLNDVIPTSDGGFAACGYVYPMPPDGGSLDAWVLKVDSMGCDTPGCATGTFVKELSSFDGGKWEELRVWPNPAREMFQVQCSMLASSKFQVGGNCLYLIIYNSQGMKVKEIELPAEKEDITVDVTGWQKGIYYLRMTADGKNLGSGKVVVLPL